jgi:hypothetical protein
MLRKLNELLCNLELIKTEFNRNALTFITKRKKDKDMGNKVQRKSK